MYHLNPIINKRRSSSIVLALVVSVNTYAGETSIFAANVSATVQEKHQTVKFNEVEIFYHKAGSRDAPLVLLLHGLSVSSHMVYKLIPSVLDKYPVVAPDYPEFGNSKQPKTDHFDYSFDRYCKGHSDLFMIC